jgi:putative oxidoreductase
MNVEPFARHRDEVQGVLRIATGLLFMQHGAQKLFGWLDGRQVENLVSQMGLAGILEFFGGLLIVLGLLTVPVALLLMVEMFWAFVQAHLPQGGWPIQNAGELPLLYAFVYMYFATAGAGAFSLDQALGRRRAERAI